MTKALKKIPILGSLFSTPKMPDIPEPAVMPDPDDEALKNRKRREFARVRQRSGRLSTMNVPPRDTALG